MRGKVSEEHKEQGFLKYPSIINDYHAKDISYWLGQIPGLAKMDFVITEKIHGSNLQLIFEPNEPMKVGSRTRILKAGTNFYGIWEVLERYEPVTLILQTYADESDSALHMYGELCGPGIQKGVNYGDEKRILFFDMRINGLMVSQGDFWNAMSQMGLIHHCVPTIASVMNLKTALEYDINRDSFVLPRIADDSNIMEGVVIKPLNSVLISPQGATFMIKKKNRAFLEQKSKPREPRKPDDPQVAALNLEFRELINENRLQSVFSKHGEIERHNQIGDYIRLVLEDAKEDFLKEHSVDGLDKAQTRAVFNMGSTIANMVKAYL